MHSQPCQSGTCALWPDCLGRDGRCEHILLTSPSVPLGWDGRLNPRFCRGRSIFCMLRPGFVTSPTPRPILATPFFGIAATKSTKLLATCKK
ncbi:unnamed protein product [Protopolystoma xenopodis]|uniref:Uncharacterized protein n=1 Tax=Protopolystoma xenopodis TaxID=117903 RepID=A0A448WX81_9PLAT|nr:unnamed protein product [Protopolystoma xenopodis]